MSGIYNRIDSDEEFEACIRVAMSVKPKSYPAFVGVQVQVVYPADGNGAESPPGLEEATTNNNELVEWMKSVESHIKTLISELINIGATDEKRYEKVYTKFLATCDQTVTELKIKRGLMPGKEGEE